MSTTHLAPDGGALGLFQTCILAFRALDLALPFEISYYTTKLHSTAKLQVHL